MSKSVMVCAGAVAAATVLAGCGGAGETYESMALAPSSEVTSTSTTATETTAAETAVNAQAHNDTDVMFAQHMIPHHQQAIEMTEGLLAKPDIDERVRTLAAEIRGAQAPEIARMEGWLREWGTPPMPPMRNGGAGRQGMPPMRGMVSETDMIALRDAQGVEAARLYLTHMIAHHEGAVEMAQDEIDNGVYPAAVEMAHAIVRTQQREIDTMRAIQSEL